MTLKERYIGRKYEELTKEEIRMFEGLGIFNGFGGGGSNPIIKFLIGRILRKFNIAISAKHDYSYFIGSPDRKTCDYKFLKAMLKDSMHTGILIPYYLIISLLAYTAIRLFGKKYYGTKNN